MALGYDGGKLFILAFDHRGSFQKKMFGIQGDPDDEQTRTISDAKRLIYEGLIKATEQGAPAEAIGCLVDEQFGGDFAPEAKQRSFQLAMPVEKSGQDEFDFEYGEQVGGDTDRYDAELRPELMRRAIEELQNAGVEADVWKIEGVDERSDAEMLARQTRSGEGRERVVCVLLGRGASTEKVEHWLQQASPVDGFVGFAIGRSIWWDSLKGFLEEGLEREKAAEQIASNYLHFIRVYTEAETAVTA